MHSETLFIGSFSFAIIFVARSLKVTNFSNIIWQPEPFYVIVLEASAAEAPALIVAYLFSYILLSNRTFEFHYVRFLSFIYRWLMLLIAITTMRYIVTRDTIVVQKVRCTRSAKTIIIKRNA